MVDQAVRDLGESELLISRPGRLKDNRAVDLGGLTGTYRGWFDRLGSIVDSSWAGAVVELAEFIGELRSELSKAVASADPDGLRFELGPVELEVTVAASKEAGPGAKVRFWVVELGVDASVGRSATQRVTLTLTPTGADGRRPYVSGTAERAER